MDRDKTGMADGPRRRDEGPVWGRERYRARRDGLGKRMAGIGRMEDGVAVDFARWADVFIPVLYGLSRSNGPLGWVVCSACAALTGTLRATKNLIDACDTFPGGLAATWAD
jgi:hypothetical protein